MSGLGQLWYTLGLRTEDFDKTIDSVKKKITELQGKDVSIDASSATTALGKVEALQQALDKLKNEVSLNITGTPKTIEGGTAHHNADIVNLEEIRKKVEESLKNLSASVNVEEVKNSLKNVNALKIDVTANQSTIQGVIKKIKELLNINKVSVKVSPDWSKTAITKLQNDLQKQIKSISLKDIKVTIDKTKIQEELNKQKYSVTVDVKVNRTTVNDVLQSAVNQNANLMTGGKSSADTAKHTTEIQKQNKALTDQLGIRRSINDQMSKNTQIATMLGNALGNVFAAYQLKNFLEGLIRIGGEIQKQRLALGHIIDNVSNANTLFEQMKQLAVKSPFGLLDLMQNARQLSAFGVEYNNLYDTMKRLSDMAAGLGIQFSRLALAYGETKERGFLDGKLVRQFSYMGLPVLQKVAEYYTQIDKLQNGSVVTASQVRAMVSDKQVSFEDIDAIIQKMTEEGGQFYNMQEVMAESVAGKWKNLKDAIDIMYSDIVEGNSAILKAPASILTTLTKNYDALAIALSVLALRMVGQKAAIAMSTAVLKYNAEALFLDKKAQEELTIATIKRNGTFARLTKQEKARLATIQQMTAQEFRQLAINGNLTKGDIQRLAMRKLLTDEQKKYLINAGLITEAELKEAASMTRWGMAAKTLGASLKSLFGGLNGVFILGTIGWEIYNYFARASEKAKQFSNDIQQTADDFRKATSEMQAEIVNLDFDTMSFGERETEIKAMVEYIKDNAPDAARGLQEIFQKDSNGKFVKDTKARFNALKEWIGELEKLSMQDLSLFEEKTYNALKNTDFADAIKDFSDERKSAINTINNIFNKRTQEENLKDLEEYKKKYKTILMSFLNITSESDFSKVGINEVLRLATTNRNFMNIFLESFNIGQNNIKSWYEQYDDTMKKAYKTAFSMYDELKKLNPGKEIDLTSSEWKNKWNQSVNVTVNTLYKDESSETQGIIKRLLTEPDLLARLSVEKGNVDSFVNKMLNDVNMRSVMYLDIIPTYNGKLVENPWEEIMKGITGEVKTDGTIVGNKETITKQIQSAYTALQEAFTLSKYKDKVRKTNTNKNGVGETVWEAITGGNETVDAYANDLTTYQKKLDQAIASAKKLGLDTDHIIAEANKKFNKKEYGTTTSKKDTLLESWKEQFDELKKTFSEFEKWSAKIGRQKAGEKMMSLGLIDKATADQLADPDYYKKKVEELQSIVRKQMGNNVARNKFNTSLSVEISQIDLKIQEEAIRRATEQVQKEINNAAKQYDIWKTWFEATGDERLALNMSVGITPIWNMESESLRKQLEKSFKDANVDISKVLADNNISDMWGIDVLQEDMKKVFDNAGLTEQYNKYKAIYDMIWKSGEQFSKDIANSVKSLQTYEDKVTIIEKKYADLLDADKKLGGLNQYNLERAKNVELSKLYKPVEQQFLTASTTLAKSEAIKVYQTLLDKINNLFNEGSISAEEYNAQLKKLDDALQKNAESSKNEFEALLKGGKGGLVTFLKSQIEGNTYKQDKLENEIEKQGYMTDEQAKQMNALNKSTKAYEDAIAKINAFSNSMSLVNASFALLTSSLKGFQDLLSSFADVFEATGKQNDANRASDIADGISAVNSAFDGISGVLQSAMNLDLGGLVSNAISAPFKLITNPITAFSKLADKKLERQIEQNQFQNTTLKNINDNMARILERTLGGIYKMELDEDTKTALKNIANNKDNYTGNDAKYSQNTRDMAKQALKDNSYYNAQYASLLAQRDNMQEILKAENDKKNTDNSKVEEYKKQLQEIEEQVSYFAEDMMKNLYSIDFKAWANQLGDALVEAWRKGEDSAEAYSNTVKDLIAGVTKSVISQSIIETAMTPILEDFKKAFTNNGAKLNEQMIVDLATSVEAQGQGLADAVNTYLETMKSLGYDLSDTESLSSASNSIKGITEEQADILAALVQGIRLDLSLQRVAVENIRDLIGGTEGGRSLNVIAEAQLTQLNSIATNTYNTHQELNSLNTKIDEVINGTKAFAIQ